MSYQGRRDNTQFRSILDIGMGLFYIAIGGYLVIVKSFGNMSVPPWIAYILGGMMMIGGGARLYRGIKPFLPQKKYPDTFDSPE